MCVEVYTIEEFVTRFRLTRLLVDDAMTRGHLTALDLAGQPIITEQEGVRWLSQRATE